MRRQAQNCVQCATVQFHSLGPFPFAPDCGGQVWGKPDLKLVCGEDGSEFVVAASKPKFLPYLEGTSPGEGRSGAGGARCQSSLSVWSAIGFGVKTAMLKHGQRIQPMADIRDDIAARREAIDNALASVRLEGLEPLAPRPWPIWSATSPVKSPIDEGIACILDWRSAAKPGAEFRDPYLDRETGIMRNRLGIRDQPTLDRVEAELTAFRAAELARSPVQGKFDLAHLQTVHQRLFGDVSEWAGKLRTVEIATGDTQFGPRSSIGSYMAQIADNLGHENHLRGLDSEQFSRRAAYYFGEVNAVHPFREGNGRAQREFIGQLAHEAGYHIRWSGMSREEMTHASIEAWRAEPALLTKMIRENLVDRDRERAAEIARAASGDKVHLVRAEPGQTHTGRIIGQSERYVIQERADKPGEMVLHSRRALSGFDAAALRGQAVEISYPHGKIGLVREVAPRETGQERQQHGIGANRDKPDRERERER